MLPHQANNGDNLLTDGAEVHAEMLQHAAALTMGEEIRRYCGEYVRLLTQDPQYSNDAKEFLKGKGFEIVGDFGAGGFDDVDDNSIVFSAWANAPVKQIIADIARSAMFITIGNERSTFNQYKSVSVTPLESTITWNERLSLVVSRSVTRSHLARERCGKVMKRPISRFCLSKWIS